MTTSPCQRCGAAPARLYPHGWRCDEHGSPQPSGRYCMAVCYCRACPSWRTLPERPREET